MKATLFLAIFTAFELSFTAGQCPNSTWIHRGNKCYLVKNELADIFENIALCNQVNASLVSIVNEQENNEVDEITSPYSNGFWLGLGQRANASEAFYWFDGRPFLFSSWSGTYDLEYEEYWAAYFHKGNWYKEYFSAFGQHYQMCSIDLNRTTPYKKTPNPADIGETLVSKQCPNSTWIRRGNKCYFVKREEADLYENIDLCNQLNASLVSIASEAENIQVSRLMSSTTLRGSLWLGLGQRPKYSGQYYWFDGSPFVFSNWRHKPRLSDNYFGARLSRAEWSYESSLLKNIQVCHLDLSLNTPPKKTPNPAEFKETSGQCPNKTWKRIGNKCIFIDTTTFMNYTECQALCKTLNAKMVQINSNAENIQLSRLFPYTAFWLGLKPRDGYDHLYDWEDGSPVTYESWNYGKPFNSWKQSRAYSDAGNWYSTEQDARVNPSCQMSLTTNPEEATAETTTDATSIFTATTQSKYAISKSGDSPSDVVTEIVGKLSTTTFTYNKIVTALKSGKVTIITENNQKTDLSDVEKDVIPLIKNVNLKTTDTLIKIPKSKQ